jgi:hypothetical protein
VFEVRGGVNLSLGERIALADGWWFSTNSDPFGPFETDQAALNAAAASSDATVELHVLVSPTPPLPVTDPGEIFPSERRRQYQWGGTMKLAVVTAQRKFFDPPMRTG